MVIDCSKEDEKYLKLPRGTYDYLESLCNVNNIEIISKDERFVGNKIEVKFNGSLRNEQQIAVDNLLKYTNNIFKYYGGIGKKILKNYMELNNQINKNEENKIIVATGSYIGEGFDDSKLDVLFLTMPISGQTRVTQYVGRLHRQDSNKKEILIYDYIDDNFSKTRNMFLKRKKTYEKLGYEIVEENECLNFNI